MAATTTSVRVACRHASSCASVDRCGAVRCMSVSSSAHPAGTTLGVINTDGLSSHGTFVDVDVCVGCMHVSTPGWSSTIRCTVSRTSSVATRRISRSHHSGEHHAHHHTSDESRHHASLSLLLDDNDLPLSINLSLRHASLHKHVEVSDLEFLLSTTH